MPANNFQDIGKALLDAMETGNKDDFRRIMVDVFRQLDQAGGIGARGMNGAPISGTRTSRIPQQLVDHTAGRTQSPLNTQASTKGSGIVEGKQTSFDRDSGYNLQTAMVAIGESVTSGASVCVINNVAYLADGTNEARLCHGVCVRGTGKNREILWRPGGTAIARVKRSTAISGYGALYQSATPGMLTNDPDEVGLAYVQQVGHFKAWVPTQQDLAEVTITIAGAGSGSGAATWGSIGGDIDDQLDLLARLELKEDALTYGTAGQVMATNATVDGYIWTDPYGETYIDGGSFSDTYTSSPFDIDGGTLP